MVLYRHGSEGYPMLNARRSVLLSAILILLAPMVSGCSAPKPDARGRELAEGVRSLVTPSGLEEQLGAIAQYERPSGSEGENAAIDHIVATLRGEGIPVDIYTFQAYASDPVSATIEVVGADLEPEAITYSFSAIAERLEGRLVDVGTLDDLPDLEPGTGERLVLRGDAAVRASAAGGLRGGGSTQVASVQTDLPDLAGAIALIEGNPGTASVDQLAHMGAAGAIFINSEERLNDLIVTTTWGTPSLRNYHRLPTLPAAHVNKSDGEALRSLMSRGTVSVRLTTEVETGWKEHRLAVARIPAPDPEAPYVVFGGHIDAWYHGACDEAASNAAMLELARAFYHHRALLRRGLVVAWWPGHSNARYGGSTWYADNFFDDLRSRAVAYVNVDGIGQRDAKRFSANASAALAGLAGSVVQQRTGEEIRPRRPGRNSDQSFNGVGLPLLQLNHNRLAEDGGYWWWHTPEDTLDKVDPEVLKVDADLYADGLAALLADPVLPVDLVAQVEALGAAIERRQAEAGERFDLGEARRRQVHLSELVDRIQGSLTGGGGVQVDLALVGVLRPLHRVMYSPSSPFHPDPGLDSRPLPGFSALGVFAEEDPASDRYRFAEVSLIRERNRLLEALDRSTAAAERLLASGGL